MGQTDGERVILKCSWAETHNLSSIVTSVPFPFSFLKTGFSPFFCVFIAHAPFAPSPGNTTKKGRPRARCMCRHGKTGSFVYLWPGTRRSLWTWRRGYVEGYISELVSFLSIAAYLPPLIENSYRWDTTLNSIKRQLFLFFIDTKMLIPIVPVVYAPILF